MRTTDAHRVSHADVLEGLRQTLHRQIVRSRHPVVLDVLHVLGFIDWVRQPERASRYLAANSARADAYSPPVDIAMLTAAGRTELDRLIALELTVQWTQRQIHPYVE
jgi:hypothetical protein